MKIDRDRWSAQWFLKSLCKSFAKLKALQIFLIFRNVNLRSLLWLMLICIRFCYTILLIYWRNPKNLVCILLHYPRDYPIMCMFLQICWCISLVSISQLEQFLSFRQLAPLKHPRHITALTTKYTTQHNSAEQVVFVVSTQLFCTHIQILKISAKIKLHTDRYTDEP